MREKVKCEKYTKQDKIKKWLRQIQVNRKRYTDKEIYRERDVQRKRYTEIETYRERDIQRKRHTEEEIHRERDIQRKIPKYLSMKMQKAKMKS